MLASELISSNIEFEFQWNEYDDDGNQIGDEHEIVNPPENDIIA